MLNIIHSNVFSIVKSGNCTCFLWQVKALITCCLFGHEYYGYKWTSASKTVVFGISETKYWVKSRKPVYMDYPTKNYILTLFVKYPNWGRQCHSYLSC